MYAAIPPSHQYRKFRRSRESTLEERYGNKFIKGKALYTIVYRNKTWSIYIKRGEQKPVVIDLFHRLHL